MKTEIKEKLARQIAEWLEDDVELAATFAVRIGSTQRTYVEYLEDKNVMYRFLLWVMPQFKERERAFDADMRCIHNSPAWEPYVSVKVILESCFSTEATVSGDGTLPPVFNDSPYVLFRLAELLGFKDD